MVMLCLVCHHLFTLLGFVSTCLVLGYVPPGFFKVQKIYMEKMNFTSLKACNLNFMINFGHVATQFLTNMPIWACLIAKTGKKFKLWPVRQVKCTVSKI